MILNFSSLVGRLSSGFAAHNFGAPLTIVLCALCCGAVTLGMIGVQSVASVVLVGVFFGFFAGACKPPRVPRLQLELTPVPCGRHCVERANIGYSR